MKTSRAPGRVTLPRAISKLGFASRSQALRLIGTGEVVVNGVVERNPHRWIDLIHDRIEIHSSVLARQSFRYMILYKPAGVVTTKADEHGRTTVMDLLGEEGAGLNPVGRLDKETTGLLLFTNDNQLADRLTSPNSGVMKRYAAGLDRPFSKDHLRHLSAGIEIHLRGREVLTKPAIIHAGEPGEIEISISEGKNRQIRRMLESIGYEVRWLHRIAVGPLELGSLRVGQSRELTSDEVQALKRVVGFAESETPRKPSVHRFQRKGLRASHRKPGR